MKATEAFEEMRVIGRNVWKTRSGQRLTFADMDCGHLRNVARMMRRQHRRAVHEADACAGYSGGDMAEYYAEQAMDEAFRQAGRIDRDITLVARYVRLRESYGLILEGPK